MTGTAVWMPIYWADYLADTTHLTTEEHGFYLLLLATYWRRAKPLPDDDKFLATVTKSSTKKWKMVRPKISEFFDISEGVWKHKRVEFEILKSSDRLKSARSAGRAGGLAKAKLITITTTNTEEDTSSLRSDVRAPTPKPSSKSVRGTRWPADGVVPEDWVQAAGMKRAERGIPEIDLRYEAERFQNYWASKSGQAATKVDWRLTWMNWATDKTKTENGNGGSRHNGKNGTAHDRFLAGAYEFIQESSGRAGSRGAAGDDAEQAGDALLPPGLHSGSS